MSKIGYEEGQHISERYGYEDYGEPLKEYRILSGDRIEETATSCSLISVEKMENLVGLMPITEWLFHLNTIPCLLPAIMGLLYCKRMANGVGCTGKTYVWHFNLDTTILGMCTIKHMWRRRMEKWRC